MAADLHTSTPCRAPSRRACDRCHSVKAKCFPSEKGICHRCFRLGHECRLTRPIQPLGRPALSSASLRLRRTRKPRQRSPRDKLAEHDGLLDLDLLSPEDPVSTVLVAETFHPFPAVQAIDDLTEVERNLLNYCLDPDRVLNLFLVGPSFAATMKAALALRFATAMPLVKDAYAACAGCFAEDQSLSFKGLTRDVIHRQAATAVKILRTETMDITNLLSISLAIYTFSQYGYGQSTFTVCRYILDLVRQKYDTRFHVLDADSRAFLASIASAETFECLWRCEIPTLRLTEHPTNAVDRYVGVSIPLISILHDLCELNIALKHADDTDLSQVMKSIERTEQRLGESKLNLSSDTFKGFPASEVMCISVQYEVFRLAGLLIVHRLRHPYGSNDNAAVLLSKAIVQALSSAREFSGRNIKSGAYPYVFACMEITGASDRQEALRNVPYLIGYTAVFQSKIRAMMTRSWQARDKYGVRYWYDYGCSGISP